jgi:cytochrome c2
MKVRPWMQVRMPTFQFTDQQAALLVAGFAAEGDQPQFDTHQFSTPSPRNVAIGREVFNMLRCQQCHSLTPVDPANPPVPNVADTQSLAPNLTFSKIRLRHDWVADWMRRPDEMIPGTRMPTNFPRDPKTGGFQSPLAMAMDSPQFAAQKAALLPHFANEAALEKTMADAVALTNYMRDYIWSIGIDRMRSAGAGEAGPQPGVPRQEPTTPAAPAVQTVEGAAGAGAQAARRPDVRSAPGSR